MISKTTISLEIFQVQIQTFRQQMSLCDPDPRILLVVKKRKLEGDWGGILYAQYNIRQNHRQLWLIRKRVFVVSKL